MRVLGLFLSFILLTNCATTTATQIVQATPSEQEWFVWRDRSMRPATPPPQQPVPVWAHRLIESQMAQRPSPEQIQRSHPAAAAEHDVPGAVILEGRVRDDGSLVWRVVSVSQSGWHFEDAAIRVGSLYRAPLNFPDGRSTAGASFVTVIGFTSPPPRPDIVE